MLVTNQHIFNIKPCGSFNSMIAKLFNSVKIKRKISLKLIQAITVSRFGSEFIIHIPEQYDYRFSSEKFSKLDYLFYISRS